MIEPFEIELNLGCRCHYGSTMCPNAEYRVFLVAEDAIQQAIESVSAEYDAEFGVGHWSDEENEYYWSDVKRLATGIALGEMSQ